MKYRGTIKLYSAYVACLEMENYTSVNHRKEIFNSWERKHKEDFYTMFIQISPIAEIRSVRKADGMNHGSVDVLN